MAKSPNWTSEELEILREVYPRTGRSQELQDCFPNRTMEGIALKANRLGLKVINNIRKGKTDEEYREACEKTDFVPLEPYLGSTVPILHMCGICEHEWKARPQQILRPGARCPKCDIKHRKDSALLSVKEVLAKTNMEMLSEYLGSFEPLTLRHTLCGNTWTTAYSYIQQGSGCPKCNKGFGYRYGSSVPVEAYLYVIDIIFINGEHCIKVGITSRDPEIRFTEISSAIKTDNLIKFTPVLIVKGPGKVILSLEYVILNTLDKYKSNITFHGDTELLEYGSLKEVQRIILENTNVKIISKHSSI